MRFLNSRDDSFLIVHCGPPLSRTSWDDKRFNGDASSFVPGRGLLGLIFQDLHEAAAGEMVS